jgi:CheY-like chemotaxis protein
MQDRNGFEAARALRQDPRTGALTLIAHTALDEAGMHRKVTGDEFDS